VTFEARRPFGTSPRSRFVLNVSSTMRTTDVIELPLPLTMETEPLTAAVAAPASTRLIIGVSTSAVTLAVTGLKLRPVM